MKLLTDIGLFDQELIQIYSPAVVKNYNDCLVAIGQEPTSLKEFHIDGSGWSPEIANEKGNIFYLANGEANPYAIIVTPQQADKPIYYPHHSFDIDLLQTVFSTAARQISDLTSETGLWIELDQEFDTFVDPDDLLMIDRVIVRVHSVASIMSAAREQRQLVHELRQGENWMNAELRTKVQDSGKTRGDLRFRSLVIPDIPYLNLACYYTRVFGGVYVFRDKLRNSKLLMILEDEGRQNGRKHVLLLKHTDEVLDRLLTEGLIECNPEMFREGTDSLKRIGETILSRAIFAHERSNLKFDMTMVTHEERLSYVEKLKDKLPEEYAQLQRLTKMLKREGIVHAADLSQGLQRLLFRPVVKRQDDPVLHDLVMRILVSLNIFPYEEVYAHNRAYFFSQYLNWTKAEKRWSRVCIKGESLVH